MSYLLLATQEVTELGEATVKHRISTLSLVLAVSLASLCIQATSFSGKVVRVIDGDSIEVMHDRTPEQVRLDGVDCPEKTQAFGTVAKRYTIELVFGKIVTIESKGKDRYGRTLGEVSLPDGRSLNKELVKAGLAWWYRKYSSDKSLEALEAEAREAKRGLWVDKDPTPPWAYRKAKRGK